MGQRPLAGLPMFVREASLAKVTGQAGPRPQYVRPHDNGALSRYMVWMRQRLTGSCSTWPQVGVTRITTSDSDQALSLLLCGSCILEPGEITSNYTSNSRNPHVLQVLYYQTKSNGLSPLKVAWLLPMHLSPM